MRGGKEGLWDGSGPRSWGNLGGGDTARRETASRRRAGEERSPYTGECGRAAGGRAGRAADRDGWVGARDLGVPGIVGSGFWVGTRPSGRGVCGEKERAEKEREMGRNTGPLTGVRQADEERNSRRSVRH